MKKVALMKTGIMALGSVPAGRHCQRAGAECRTAATAQRQGGPGRAGFHGPLSGDGERTAGVQVRSS